jgi:hypothetical protein
MIRSLGSAACIFALFGLSRYLDGLIRLFLRQETGARFFSSIARNWRASEAVVEVAHNLGWGLLSWTALVLLSAWILRRPRRETAVWISRSFIPLLLSVGLTTVAALSLLISPQFPYGINLALTVTYEGAFAAILVWSLVGALLLHGAAHQVRPLPRLDVTDRGARRWRLAGGVAVLVSAMSIFAWATPSWIWKDGAGQGNMFKYVRMAAALSGSGTLDIAQAEGAAENATVAGFVSQLPRMGARWLSRSGELMGALAGHGAKGELYLGEVKATKANRSMFRSHRGGVYYINAPGPGIILVPAFLIDRALNRRLGWDRQVAVILFWHLLGALLVLEMIRVSHRVVGDWGPGVIGAFALAISPPILLYTFQIYPELPAALGLLYAFRKLVMDEPPTGRGAFAAAVVLAFLPWLHQKYSVATVALGLMGAARLLRDKKGGGRILRLTLLFAPLVLSAFSIVVYNHALTGSVLPDASFRAVGRTSFDPSNMGRGFLGFLFDSENGLFIYAPIYLLALVGIRSFTRHHSDLYRPLLIVFVTYMAVIASFPYWPGAVSSVARYILSVTPFAILLIAPVIRRSFSDGVLAGAGLVLASAAWSVTAAFQQDIVHSLQPALFLSRMLYSDPFQYLPSFLSPGFFGSGPGHFLKLGAIAVGVTLLIHRLSPRVDRETRLYEEEVKRFARHAVGGAAGILTFIVFAGAVLERVPSNRTEKTGPEYRLVQSGRPGSDLEIAADGKFGFEKGGVWVGGYSTTRFTVSSPRPVRRVQVTLKNIPRKNQILLSPRGAQHREIMLEPSETRVIELPLMNPYVFEGPEGQRYLYRVSMRSRAGFVPSRNADAENPDDRNLGVFVVIAGR